MIASERPLLLVMDDLQWAEPSTMLLLAHLCRRPIPRVVIVATVRERWSRSKDAAMLDAAFSASNVERIQLEGLDRGAVADLLTIPPADVRPTSCPSDCVG